MMKYDLAGLGLKRDQDSECLRCPVQSMLGAGIPFAYSTATQSSTTLANSF
jgi:hypothetical protein